MSLLYGVRCVFSCMVCHCFVVLLVRSPPLPVLLLLPSPVGFTPWIRKPTHFAVPPAVRRRERGRGTAQATLLLRRRKGQQAACASLDVASR